MKTVKVITLILVVVAIAGVVFLWKTEHPKTTPQKPLPAGTACCLVNNPQY